MINMAQRPIFIPLYNSNIFVKAEMIDFVWVPGYSLQQKQKNVKSLHNAAAINGLTRVLEISTKSTSELGRKLSAFNLKLDIKGKKGPVEAFYQSSKVFEKGGPYLDIFDQPVWQLKKDPRLTGSGNLIKFSLFDCDWDILPQTAFYDWLYVNAIIQNKEFIQDLLTYNGFSDIEFNPKKSFSCQAHSAALFVSLFKQKIISNEIINKEKFLFLITKKKSFIQDKLFYD